MNNKTIKTSTVKISTLALGLICLIATAFGGYLDISWDPVTNSDLEGYKIYFGKANTNWEGVYKLSNITRYPVDLLGLGTNYYFAVTAYDDKDNESELSEDTNGYPWQNIIENFSFENNTNTLPGDWTVLSGNFSVSMEDVYSGHYALKLADTGAQTVRQTITIKTNTDYELSVRFKLAAGSTGTVIIDTDGLFDPDALNTVGTGEAGSWLYKSGTFNSGTETSVNIKLRTSITFDGTCYFDNVRLKQLNMAPNFGSVPVITAIENIPYSYQLYAVDGDGDPLTWQAVTIPAWLNFDTNTLILSGTPANSDIGSDPVVIRVSDGFTNTDQSFTLLIGATFNSVPVITSAPVTIITQNIGYSYTLTATDGDGQTLTYGTENLPSWLSFNTTTRLLSGSPTSANRGTYFIKLFVTDGFDTTWQNYILTVTDDDGNIVINGSFEDGETAWIIPSPFVEVNTDEAQGTGSFSLDHTATTNWLAASYQNVSIAPYTYYDISVWVNYPAATTGKITFDTAGKFDAAGEGQFDIESGSGTWVQYTGSFYSEDNEVVTLRTFVASEPGLDGTVYFDNVSLIPTGVNAPPFVNAGLDQIVDITVTNGVILDGVCYDDNYPSGFLTSTWTKVVGPGTVTFGDASNPVTTANFSTSGIYILRLTGDDSAFTTSDDITVELNVGGVSTIIASNNNTHDTYGGATAIQTAVNEASGGDTIFVFPGTYYEVVDLSVKTGISLIAYDYEMFGLNTTTVLESTATENGIVQLNNTYNCLIQGFTIRSNNIGDGVSAAGTSINNVIANNIISDMEIWGVDLGSTAISNIVRNNTIFNTTTRGAVNTGGDTVGNLILENHVYDNSSRPLIWIQGTGQTVKSNNIHNSSEDGFKIWGSGHKIIYNGISNCNWNGISLQSTCTDIEIYRNLIFNNDDAGIKSEDAANTGKFINNTIVKQKAKDAILTTAGNFEVYNNIFMSNNGAGINAVGTITHGNNLYFDNTGADRIGTATYNPDGANYSDSSPLLTAAYEISSDSSPAFNTGNNYPAAEITDVMVDGQVDIGWQESPYFTGGNTAPVITVNGDNTVIFPAAASISGTSTDDGLPSGVLTNTWSKTSGPGTVTFGDLNSLSTTATFSLPGTYVLRLTGFDGAVEGYGELTIEVSTTVTASNARSSDIYSGAGAIQTAVTEALDDDTIYVFPGTHSGQVDLSGKSGLSLIAYAWENGNDTTSTVLTTLISNDGVLRMAGNTDCTVAGFTIGNNSWGFGLLMDGPSTYNSITANRIIGNGVWGLRSEGDLISNFISNNLFSNNLWASIIMQATDDYNFISSNNITIQDAYPAIWLKGDYNTVVSNYLHDLDEDGIKVLQGTGNKIIYNTICDNLQDGIEITTSANGDIEVYRNLLYRNNRGISAGAAIATGKIINNTILNSTGNFGITVLAGEYEIYNNIIMSNASQGLNNTAGTNTYGYNLFFNNTGGDTAGIGTNILVGSNISGSSPLLDTAYLISSGTSPAVESGTNYPAADIIGVMENSYVDLGWMESSFSGSESNTNVSPSGNLVSNWSFETGDAVGWDKGDVESEITTEIACEGYYSHKYSSAAGDMANTLQWIDLETNAIYHLSFWVNYTAGTTGTAIFDTWDVFDAPPNRCQVSVNTDTGGWVRYVRAFTNDITNQIRIRMFDSPSVDGTVFYDAISITKEGDNRTPYMTSVPVTFVKADEAYSYTLASGDDDGDVLSYGSITVPSWATFNAGTGVLSGTPAVGDVGDHQATLTVSDGEETFIQNFTITVGPVNSAPTVDSTAVTAADEDALYSYTFVVSDVDAGDTLTLSAPTLPTWLNFNTTTGLLDGTPSNDDVGSNDVTLSVSDGTVNTDQSFTIIVANVNDNPVIGSTAVTSATEEVLYNYTFSATDVDADDTLTYSAPTLPTWLNFDTGSGLLDGTPGNDDVGTNQVVLRVNDGTTNIDQTFDIIVANVNDDPQIDSTAITTATQDIPYTYTFAASDIDADDVLTYSAPTLPSWLNFNTSSGLLDGTPANDDVGAHTVKLRVNDGTVNIDQDFTINVANVNDDPVITSTPVTNANKNSPYSYTLTANDIDTNDTLTFIEVDVPAWLSFNTGTGLLDGTPLLADVGSHNVTLRINDGTVNVDQSFTIEVTDLSNSAPVFDSTAITAATEEVIYSYTAAGSDSDGDPITFSAPTLPAWLDFDTNSLVLSGTPSNSEVGDHSVTLRVTDGIDSTDQIFTITVANVNDAPVITSTEVTSATEDSPYSYTFEATDIDTNDTLTLSAPVLPGWLTFDAGTGVLSGTPTNENVGTNSVTLRVFDGTVNVDQVFDIIVANVNDDPQIDSTAITAAVQDTLYTYTFAASDIDVNDTLTYSAPTLPTWLSFDTGTGVLDGTPGNDDVGSHTVKLRVNDGTVNIDQDFSITVANVNDAPVITSTEITSATEDSSYSYTFEATDIDTNDTLTLSAPVLPGWLTFDAGTGVLSGTPTNENVGTNSVTLRVFDGTVNVDQAFDIIVVNVNDDPVIESTAITAATEDTPYTYNFLFSDVDADDVLTASAPNLPAWLDFDITNNILSGTPENGDVGSNDVTLRVNDGTVDIDQNFTIVVVNVNDEPTIDSTPVTTATQDIYYSYTLAASDVDADDTLVFSAPTLPGWLSFNTASGLLDGTPDNGDVGSHPVTLRVDDGTVSVDQIFTIVVVNVNDDPTIDSTAITAATEDSLYSYMFLVSDIDPLDTLTLSAPTLPTWLNFNTTSGLLDGTPANSDVGSNDVTLRVNDGTVDIDQNFTIVVANVNDDPSVDSTAVTAAGQDSPYSYTFVVSDIDPNDTLTLSAPTLPGWLNFNTASGLLDGTPVNGDVGSHPVTLRVNDGTVDVDQIFTISVSNVNDAPSITSIAITNANKSTPYNYTITADDIDTNDTLTFSAPVLPGSGWLTFDTGTQLLSGTPIFSDVGPHSVTLRVSDGTVNVDQVFTIVVTDISNTAPVFDSTEITTATEELPYSYTAAVSDGDSDPLTLSAPTIPAWLSFDTNTKILSGTPLNDDVGDHSVTIRVFDGIDIVDQNFTITVANVNDDPTISSSPTTSINEDAPYSYTISASDIDDGDVLSYSAPTLPLWLSFNTNTQVLNGIPQNIDVGTNYVTLRVNDGTVDVDQVFEILVINVNDDPVIESTADTSATEEVLYSYTFTVSDVDLGDILTLSAPTIPAWLSFNITNGILSGTPANSDVGTHSVTLRVNDGSVDVDENFTISVANVNDDPTIDSTAPTTATENIAYSYTFSASDVDTNDTLTYSAPTLPVSGWLSFNAGTGELTGTPANSDVGSNNVVLRVNDGTVDIDEAFTIIVANVNDAPVIDSIAKTNGNKNTPYSYTITATDIDADAVLTFSEITVPSWLTFDTGTQVLSGTPLFADIGSHLVSLSVSDGIASDSQTFTIIVTDLSNNAPVFDSPAITAATEDTFYTYTAVASDADAGDPLVYSEVTIPTWLSFNTGTQVLSGTPSNANVGSHSVILNVNDGTVDTEQNFTITVANVNDDPVIDSTAVTSATEDVSYTYTFAASDVDTNDTLTYSAVTLPGSGWLSFDAGTGELSGIPSNDDVGSNDVSLRVFDGTINIDQNFTIIVANVNDAPVIDSIAKTNANKNNLYSYTVTATDVDANTTLTFSGDTIPGWLNFDITNGVLSGTPIFSDVGTHNVSISVSDGSLSDSQTFDIEVTDISNNAPVFDSTEITTATEDVFYTYTAAASDADAGDTLVYSAITIPTWLSFNTGTQVLSGTPSNANVGAHSVILNVNDGTVDTEQNFTITVANVNDNPVIDSTAATSATEDVSYTYTFAASDIDTNDTLTYSAVTLPGSGWLSFDTGTGVLSGIPLNDDVGSNDVSLRVFDGTINIDQDFTIIVANVNDAPVIDSIEKTNANKNNLYSYTVTATDVDANTTLTFSGDIIPGWLTFNITNGVLSGTPIFSDVGTHNVSISVSDGTASDVQTFDIEVTDASNNAPVFDSTEITTATEDVLYTYTAAASDVDAGDTLVYSAPTLPVWLSFDVGTQVLSGTPSNANVGDHSVVINVNDGTADTQQSFTITVANVNDSPAIDSTAITSATQDISYTYTFTASDIDTNDTLTYSAPILPTWLNFNTSSGVLNGTPDNSDVGVHPVRLRVNDGTVDLDQDFTITVANVNDAPVITSTAVIVAEAGTPYSYQFIASDIDTNDTPTYSAPTLPGWLNFDTGTGLLTGTPEVSNIGTNSVVLQVSDGTVDIQQSFDIVVSKKDDTTTFNEKEETKKALTVAATSPWGLVKTVTKDKLRKGGDTSPDTWLPEAPATKEGSLTTASVPVYSGASVSSALTLESGDNIEVVDPIAGSWKETVIGESEVKELSTLSSDFSAESEGSAWNESDSCKYIFTETSGDYIFTIKVSDIEGESPYASCGIMVRENLNTGSPHALVSLDKVGINYQMRLKEDVGCITFNEQAPADNNYLKLTKENETYKFYSSADGIEWKLIRIVVLPASSSNYTGIFFSSGDNGESSTFSVTNCKFSEVR